jgi:hypothetical protein
VDSEDDRAILNGATLGVWRSQSPCHTQSRWDCPQSMSVPESDSAGVILLYIAATVRVAAFHWWAEEDRVVANCRPGCL